MSIVNVERGRQGFQKIPLAARFWTKVRYGPECWEWTGMTDGGRSHGGWGYGRVFVDGRLLRAHRIAYELMHGQIPKGLHVLHHCDNPLCVRPEHLFLGTDVDNARDCVQKRRNGHVTHPEAYATSHGRLKTQCPQGHPYDASNTYHDTRRQRGCKECRRQATRDWRARKKVEAPPA